MDKYGSLIADLETSSESFNTLSKKHGFVPATAYNAIGRVRPDLLGPRSERLGFTKIQAGSYRPSASDKAAAVQKVLDGEAVKDVAEEFNIPAPTLYKYVSAAKSRSQVANGPPTESPLDRVKESVRLAIEAGEGREDILRAVLEAL